MKPLFLPLKAHFWGCFGVSFCEPLCFLPYAFPVTWRVMVFMPVVILPLHLYLHHLNHYNLLLPQLILITTETSHSDTDDSISTSSSNSMRSLAISNESFPSLPFA